MGSNKINWALGVHVSSVNTAIPYCNDTPGKPKLALCDASCGKRFGSYLTSSNSCSNSIQLGNEGRFGSYEKSSSNEIFSPFCDEGRSCLCQGLLRSIAKAQEFMKEVDPPPAKLYVDAYTNFTPPDKPTVDACTIASPRCKLKPDKKRSKKSYLKYSCLNDGDKKQVDLEQIYTKTFVDCEQQYSESRPASCQRLSGSNNHRCKYENYPRRQSMATQCHYENLDTQERAIQHPRPTRRLKRHSSRTKALGSLNDALAEKVEGFVVLSQDCQENKDIMVKSSPSERDTRTKPLFIKRSRCPLIYGKDLTIKISWEKPSLANKK